MPASGFWIQCSVLFIIVATSAGGEGAKASLTRHCSAPLLADSLPTLLSPQELDMWAQSDAPGAAPPEFKLEAMAQLWERCEAKGGRLWEVLAPEAADGIALCAASVCDSREVLDILWPQKLRTAGARGNASKHATATELGHWKQLKLDFVFAGFEKCGTSSLSHNLARHPEVEFVPVPSDDPRINSDGQQAQDGHVFWQVGNRLLPARDLIESFNAGRCCSGGARVDGFSDEELIGEPRHFQGKSALRARGERNPVYVFHRVIMKMVSLVPNAKVVLLTCDPIRWLHSAYSDTMNWFAGKAEDPIPPKLREFALSDFVAAPKRTSLSDIWYNLSRRRAFFTRFAEGVLRIMGGLDRVHMLHRDSVDASLAGPAGVREAYDRLAKFLGLQPFSSEFSFELRNIRRKPVARPSARDLTLCQADEDKALKTLKRYYRSEYSRMPEWLAKLGGLVPPHVAANRSCCDA